MTELKIRRGVAADVDEIEQLERQCFAVPWSKESLLYDVAENRLAVYFVAQWKEHIIGYAGVWCIVDEGHITNVAVSPKHRRKQVGTALMETLIRETEKEGITCHTLEVRAGNEAALRLYRKLGFEALGVRKGYYEDNGEDAVIMWRRRSGR